MSAPADAAGGAGGPGGAPPHPARPLLLIDYDGTLAPIVADPAAAHPHPEAPALVEALARRHPLYVITGRDLEAAHRLLGVSVPAVGLHGAEEGVLGESSTLTLSEQVRAGLDDRRAAVPSLKGVVVEAKGPAFAVHYRAAPDEAAAVDALRAWAARLPEGLEAVWGKKVVELKATGVSKGTAVRGLAAEHAGTTPVYLGDDTTDEHAFEALHALQGPDPVTVKVGPGETTARYRLGSVDAVVGYLRGFLR